MCAEFNALRCAVRIIRTEVVNAATLLLPERHTSFAVAWKVRDFITGQGLYSLN